STGSGFPHAVDVNPCAAVPTAFGGPPLCESIDLALHPLSKTTRDAQTTELLWSFFHVTIGSPLPSMRAPTLVNGAHRNNWQPALLHAGSMCVPRGQVNLGELRSASEQSRAVRSLAQRLSTLRLRRTR